jgi:hypothetical protein
MKIGRINNNNNDEESSISIENLWASENIFERMLYIGSRQYKLDLEPLVKFNKPIDELSDKDINDSLVDGSAYRTTFLSTRIDLEKTKRFEETKLKVFISNQSDEIRRQFPALKEKDIFNKVISKNMQMYTEKTDYINELSLQTEFLKEFDEILSQRIWILKAWLDRRQQVKGNKGYENAI